MEMFGPNITKMEKERDIEGLSRLLRHEKSSIREKVALALDRFAWKPQDEANKAWYLAAKRNWQELAGLGKPAFAPLILALRTSDENVQLAAGNVLEQVASSHSEYALHLLGKALCDQMIEIGFFYNDIKRARNRTIQILTKMGDSSVVIPFARSIDRMMEKEEESQRKINPGIHPSQFTHRESDAYANQIKQAIKEIGESAIPPLIKALTSKAEGINFRTLTDCISAIGPSAIGPLAKLLDHESGAVRSATISALGHINDNSTFDLLVKALQDHDPAVRLAAVTALSQMVGPRVVKPLVGSLRDKAPRVREKAASSLLQRSWRPATAEDKAYFLLAQMLLELSTKGSTTIFKAKELRAMGMQAVDPLIHSLGLEGTSFYKDYHPTKGDRSRWIPSRSVVLSSLLDIGPLAIPALEKALEDPDPVVQQGAQEALAKLKGGRQTSVNLHVVTTEREMTKERPANQQYEHTSGTSLQARKNNGLAIASLVLGIVAIPLDCCLGFGTLLGVAGFIAGLIGFRQAKNSGSAQSGEGMALAGMILGGVGVLIGLAMIAYSLVKYIQG
jgi:HEAT repeat protein